MPRLLQWLRDKNSSASRSHSYQLRTKPSYVEHSARSDVDFGGPWNRSGSTAAILTDNYVRLEERSRVDGQDVDFELQRDKSGGPDLATLTNPFEIQTRNNKGVGKNVRVETSYSA